MLQQLKNIYRSLPPWSTAFLKYVPDGLLFGKSFRACAPRTDLACVNANLKRALDSARMHTVWGREHIPEKIDEVDAEKILSDLPCVSSAELAAEPERFIADTANGRNSYSTTTGGTGRNPTTIRLSNASYGIEWAHMLKIWELGGYVRRRDVKATFRGYHLRPGELVRRDPIYNEMSVDPFQTTDANFSTVLSTLQKAGVTCLHGYPSLIQLFMVRCKMAGKCPLKIREIMLGSEGASVELKRELASYFGARIVSWYGLSEKVVLAFDEQADGRFVNFTSYGYPRVVDPDADDVGEIVGTTFVNAAMPLVNYRTGDYGRVVREGNRLLIENLQGRWGKDFVYKSPAEKIPTSAINLHGTIQEKIVFYQLVQREYGKLVVKVLPKRGTDPAAVLQEMAFELAVRLKGFAIDCQLAASDAEFLRSKRGKLLMLVQDLSS